MALSLINTSFVNGFIHTLALSDSHSLCNTTIPLMRTVLVRKALFFDMNFQMVFPFIIRMTFIDLDYGMKSLPFFSFSYEIEIEIWYDIVKR